MVDTQVVHTGGIRSKAKANLAQGTEVAQHGIEHHYQVRVPVKVLRVVVCTTS